jgi:hypothetical protein
LFISLGVFRRAYKATPFRGEHSSVRQCSGYIHEHIIVPAHGFVKRSVFLHNRCARLLKKYLYVPMVKSSSPVSMRWSGTLQATLRRLQT